MPEFHMIAERDFTYRTRRLKAGDNFIAKSRTDFKVLSDITGKASPARPAVEVPPPPATVIAKAQEATAPKSPAPAPEPAPAAPQAVEPPADTGSEVKALTAEDIPAAPVSASTARRRRRQSK